MANKFFSVEEFFELYDDPIKHFKDDQRITDQVSPVNKILLTNIKKKRFIIGDL